MTEKKLSVRMAEKYGVDEDVFIKTLMATAFKLPDRNGQAQQVTKEQLMMLLQVAEEHNLNPWTREIYAFIGQGGAVVPIVGVDGWIRKIQETKLVDGIKFENGPTESGIPEWITCRIKRKDQTEWVEVTEYFRECFREKSAPWREMPHRMLRHKALIQCARYAFGFGGVYDEDEGARIIEGSYETVEEPQGTTTDRVKEKLGIHGEVFEGIEEEVIE